MGRPKQDVRFKVVRMSRSYWLLYDRDNVRGYIARGSEYNVYFADNSHKLLGSGYTSMRKATETFKAHLTAQS
jgi:hypothetical protein